MFTPTSPTKRKLERKKQDVKTFAEKLEQIILQSPNDEFRERALQLLSANTASEAKSILEKKISKTLFLDDQDANDESEAENEENVEKKYVPPPRPTVDDSGAADVVEVESEPEVLPASQDVFSTEPDELGMTLSQSLRHFSWDAHNSGSSNSQSLSQSSSNSSSQSHLTPPELNAWLVDMKKKPKKKSFTMSQP